MKLSVIIVSYNVKHFLEQCLHSVRASSQGMEIEVFVVDNASVDGSVQMVQQKFGWVHCIANLDNPGFAKANNQAARLAKGEYILLLNPDTIVETDTFARIIDFMDSHPDAGGLGVKMVDGTGKFLPESKRGLPTPEVAFYKIFGLSKLFPKSRIFNRYHLGYLDKDQIHQVDVLAGAFMLLRRSVLDKTGLLDESFFMYGEDIDLSYRILQAGYKNYYFPGTRIIHYKGESTKKGSLNYVYVFYNAMIIFAKKHFSNKNARIFSALINMAIWFRAILSVISRAVRSILLPLLDSVLAYAGLAAMARMWEQQVIYPWGGHYPAAVYWLALPLLVFAWVGGSFISGGYDKPVSVWRSYRGIAMGTIVTLVVYALLPEHYRFSRLLILTGTAWGLIAFLLSRVLLHMLKVRGYDLNASKNKRFGIVGQPDEVQRVTELLQKALAKPGFVGKISSNIQTPDDQEFIGTIAQLRDIIKIYQIDELIFCARDLPAEEIIDQMSALQDTQVEFKIAPPESLSIIGSNSVNTAGDLYVIDMNSIGKMQNKRSKRLFDLVASLLLLASSPLTMMFMHKPLGYLANLISVIAGFKSLSGYHPAFQGEHRLPNIRKGILFPTEGLDLSLIDNETIQKLNMMYARDYKIGTELRLLYRGFRNLGRR